MTLTIVRWYSVSEVAKLLGINRKTVTRIPPADLPYLRLNARGDRRYTVRDVEEFVERRTVR
jgi:DNA-binding transcriptional MerR regulator